MNTNRLKPYEINEHMSWFKPTYNNDGLERTVDSSIRRHG